jgi:orotidine-5'-phosphate decarboxylase
MNEILVALDVPSEDAALKLADTLRGSVGGYKVGYQLFTAAGPSVVRSLVERGDRVFLDLKFHDIPNTVTGAMASATQLGAWMVDVHAVGGPDMMSAARQALDSAARSLGVTTPLLVAVTVLTSFDDRQLAAIGVSDPPLEQVVRLAKLSRESGCDGVVASPQEVAAIRETCGKEFLIVTPGIRGGHATAVADDQQRTATPAGAIAAGSSFLVIGRPITAAADPRAAAELIASEMTTS